MDLSAFDEPATSNSRDGSDIQNKRPDRTMDGPFAVADLELKPRCHFSSGFGAA